MMNDRARREGLLLLAAGLLAVVVLIGTRMAFSHDPVDGGGHYVDTTRSVRLNQVGFYPGAPKTAIVVDAPPEATFYVVTPDRADTVRSGVLSSLRSAPLANTKVRRADFSGLQVPGRYVVDVPDVGQSHAFIVQPRVHRGVARAALKGLYYQRASTALPRRHAGRWHRAAGHPDTTVRVHPSAASRARPLGTRIAAPKGWYDAGDYNKYVVNASIATATVLSLYEDFPVHAGSLRVDIPERANSRPDVLDEALWNLHWMLRMQAPDGGVYHKLTAPNFEGMNVSPAEADARRYVVQKSTAATLDFAAVMAQAARIFDAPGGPSALSPDSLVRAAREAWQWAQHHPDSLYNQRRLNRRFDPDVHTGAYGDDRLRDEFAWAAAELYRTTGEADFLKAADLFPVASAPVPSWSQVRTLGYYTLLREEPQNGEQVLHSRAKRLVLEKADSLVRGADTTAFRTPMGRRADDFVWGSNSVAANQGILLVWAYRLTGDHAYLRRALANLDYLLGRNATGYSFVTGVGDQPPQNPHHRPSVSDGIDPPVPGLLVGGPNPGQQDGCEYPSDAPARSYADITCSYASNEIAVNWNAPLVYLAGALEALQYDAEFTAGDESAY